MPGLGSISRAPFSKTDKRKSSAYIIPIKDNGEPSRGQALRFQYFPDSLQDTKGVNWVAREIPGGSLPIYQWVSSGERSISFTAYFSCDVDLLSPNASDDLPARLVSVGQGARNVDIRAAVAWLRQYMLPSYSAPGGATGIPTARAPQRLKLVFPYGGLGTAGGRFDAYDDAEGADDILCVMTTCDVTWEAFFPSGLPRLASVSLAFSQIAQLPQSGVKFPHAESMERVVDATSDNKEITFGYNLEVITPSPSGN